MDVASRQTERQRLVSSDAAACGMFNKLCDTKSRRYTRERSVEKYWGSETQRERERERAREGEEKREI